MRLKTGALTCSLLIFLSVVACCCYFFLGCSRRPTRDRESEVSEWLVKCPPTASPSFWMEGAFSYGSHEEWAEAGRKIEGVEQCVANLYSSDEAPVLPHVICTALYYVGTSESVPLLVGILEGDKQGYHAKLWAAAALGNIGDESAVEPLCRFVLSEEQPAVTIGSHGMLSLKVNAMAALGRIGDARAIPVIEKALKDEVLSESQREFVLVYLDKLKRQREQQ